MCMKGLVIHKGDIGMILCDMNYTFTEFSFFLLFLVRSKPIVKEESRIMNYFGYFYYECLSIYHSPTHGRLCNTHYE